ncbi:MAG TPA: hypothetical protein VKG62_05550 [Solirubrobacteraceae bacterium]|nr:hypothetical protein [Solirubrobacteraceae bacterium]
MADHTPGPRARPPRGRSRPPRGIPQTPLVVAGPFGAALDARRTAEALSRGLLRGGRPAADVCPLEPTGVAPAGALDAVDFDARLRRARAVIVAIERLGRRALPGTIVFEVATRARQGGVPAYAVAASDSLDLFDARMMDLQVILHAHGSRGLTAAGRTLAAII